MIREWIKIEISLELLFFLQRSERKGKGIVKTLPLSFILGCKLLPSYFGGTIASLQAFARRILTTVLAGILICSRVAGLKPIRAFRLERTSLPMPGRTKDPAFLVSATANVATSSTIIAAVFLERSNFSAK